MIERAAAHEGQRRHFDDTAFEQLGNFLKSHQIIKRVIQRPQIGIDLLRHVARQKAKAFAGFDRRAHQHQALDAVALERIDGVSVEYADWHFNVRPSNTEPLLRFASGPAVSQSMLAGISLGVGSILIAFGRKPGGIEKAFNLPPNYRFTWGHAVGYPLEDMKAGGQRARIKFDRLFHDGEYGKGLMSCRNFSDAVHAAPMARATPPATLPSGLQPRRRSAKRSAWGFAVP